MKRLIKSTAAIILTALTFSFASCNDVIFDEIRKEVKLEKAQISGDVRSIIRYTYNGEECLFLQNGNLWYKPIYTKDENNNDVLTGEHNWSVFTKPEGSATYRYINKIASDSTNLYAQVTLINEDTDEGENRSKGCQYWCFDGAAWNLISIESETTFKNKIPRMFCTNAVQPANRKAYINYDSYIYELNGTTATKIDSTVQAASFATGENLSTYDHKTTPTYASRSCAIMNGNVYFSSGYAFITNETKDTAATMLYYSNDDDVYYSSDASNWTKVEMNNSKIYALAVTKDYILAGTSGGITHSKLADWVPSGQTDGFHTNADSTLSSYYIVNNVLVVDPSLDEYVSSTVPDVEKKASIIYGTTIFEGSSSSTSATQENCGLWSYYPTRGKWNRE